MFTGLVEAVGELIEVQPMPSGVRLRITSALAGELTSGDSLAVSGVCLTVVHAQPGVLQADVGPETMRVTTLGRLGAGSRVNLERPLGAGDRFGGHFVQGHVDGVGRIEARRDADEFLWVTVSFPSELGPYFVPKGSIAVDGISLTVATLGADRFDVQIVPFTREHTTIGWLDVRDPVNLECDLIGKYVIRAAELAGLTLRVPEEASKER